MNKFVRAPACARWAAMTALSGVLLIGCAEGSPQGNAVPAAGAASPAPLAPSSDPSAGAGGPSSPVPGPLTGLPVATAEEAVLTVVGIPVDAGEGRPPPAGLDRADYLYVSFPNPGRQRVLALFQSQNVDRVGPVADTRPMDSKVLVAVGGVLAHGGGSPGQVTRTDKSEVPQFSAVVQPQAFRREADGTLYGSTSIARAAGGSPAIEGLVPFDSAPAPQEAAGPVTVTVPGQPPLVLSFDQTAAVWTGSLGAIPVRATNVILQQVDYNVLEMSRAASERDPVVVGDGSALVLRGAEAIEGTWNRPGRRSLTSYVGADGVPVRLLPGVTFVLLTPTGTGVLRSE